MKQEIVNIAKRYIPNDIRVFLRWVNWRRFYIQQTLFISNSAPKVYCPIAKEEYKAFVKLKDDLMTPSNGARMRQRLVWLYLTQELGILTKKLKVLHVAPELSFIGILRNQENLAYIPGDKMVEGYSNQKGIKNIDLTDLEFEDNAFDHVICNHVLEHIPDDKAAISEMFRVLKPGGSAIITVPIDEKEERTYEDFTITLPKEREKHFGQWDHVRWYGLDIKDRFEKEGFDVDMNRYADKFSKEDYRKYGLCDDIIVIAKKPLRIK